MKFHIPILCVIAAHIGLFTPGVYAAPPSSEQIKQRLDGIFKFIDGVHSDGATAPTLEPIASAPPRFVSGQVFLLNNDGSATKMALVDVCAYPSDYFSAYVNWLENDYALPARHAWGMRNIASEMVDEVSALSEKYPHEFQIDPFDLSTWRILVAAATQNLEYQLTDGWSFIAPTSIRSTTDADGRFRLKIPFGGKFYVFAIIRRGSGVNQLEFAWAVSSDSFSLDEDLVLSNRNLCSTGRAPLKNAIADAGQEHPAPPKPESTKIATRLGAMILVTKPMGGTYKIFAGNADSGILVREGETPASVDKIEPGKYTIRFSLPGYMDETKEVVVGPNGDTVDVVSVIMRPL